MLNHYAIDVAQYRDLKAFLSRCGDTAGEHCVVLIDADLAKSGLLPEIVSFRTAGFNGPILLMTGSTNEAFTTSAREAGVTDVISRHLVSAYVFSRLSELQPASKVQLIKRRRLQLKNGVQMTFRLIQPDDAGIEQDFVRGLSDKARYLRFFSWIKELPPRMLDAMTHPAFPATYAIIATVETEQKEQQIAVARYAAYNEHTAEFAVVVADEWQGQGIATELLHGIILAASIAGFSTLKGLVKHENEGMLTLGRKLGFTRSSGDEAEPGAFWLTKNLVIR